MTAPTMLAHDWFPVPLPANVVIGERAWVYSSFAFVHSRSRRPVAVRVGSDTGVYDSSFFELGESGEVEIGSFSTLVAVTIVTNARVVIGDYAFLSHDVILADSFAATPPMAKTEVDFSAEYSSHPPHAGARLETITVGANAWIGARAVLLAGAHVGEGAIVGAGCVVDFHVPPYAIAAGNPGRAVGWAKPSRR